MGCLNIHISTIGAPFKPIISELSESFSPHISSRDDSLNMALTTIQELHSSLSVISDVDIIYITTIGESLRCHFSEICTTPQDYFIEVSPEIIWLTEENDFASLVEVKSNAKWKVE